jgi:hypothetical protein
MPNENTPTEGQNSTKLEAEPALRDAAGIYCVLALIDGRPGQLFEADDWDDALRVAMECVKRSDPASAAVTTDEEIRDELESDTNWSSNQGDVWVYILQTERLVILPNDKILP